MYKVSLLLFIVFCIISNLHSQQKVGFEKMGLSRHKNIKLFKLPSKFKFETNTHNEFKAMLVKVENDSLYFKSKTGVAYVYHLNEINNIKKLSILNGIQTVLSGTLLAITTGFFSGVVVKIVDGPSHNVKEIAGLSALTAVFSGISWASISFQNRTKKLSKYKIIIFE